MSGNYSSRFTQLLGEENEIRIQAAAFQPLTQIAGYVSSPTSSHSVLKTLRPVMFHPFYIKETETLGGTLAQHLTASKWWTQVLSGDKYKFFLILHVASARYLTSFCLSSLPEGTVDDRASPCLVQARQTHKHL